MYDVYILRSISRSRYYIGYTKRLEDRIKAHNIGKVHSTKAYKLWRLVYSEKFDSKTAARKRELEIKSYKSGMAFKKLVS